MSDTIHFKNPNLDKNRPYKLVKERWTAVCPKCNEPGKGYFTAHVNKGEYISISTRLKLTCGKKNCGGKLTELIAMTLEYR